MTQVRERDPSRGESLSTVLQVGRGLTQSRREMLNPRGLCELEPQRPERQRAGPDSAGL